MIRLERLRVVEVADRPGRYDLIVERDGEKARAIAYASLTERPSPGDVVVCNTTAVDLGLGTGGVLFVLAIEGREAALGEGGHAMKARYLPVQVAVDAIEEAEAARIDASDLAGARIVACPLHSLVAPVAIAVRALRPDARIAYVMTDDAALPLAFGDLVPALRERGLLDATVTTGQAFGGDLEATTVHAGLLAARAVLEADVILVAMGPGNLGTASRWGFAGIRVADVLRAARVLGGDATLCARVSFADPRERHRGLSHHTRTVIEISADPPRLALPLLDDERTETLRTAVPRGCEPVWIDPSRVAGALEASKDLLRSMGRGYDDDPAFFLAGAAAGIDAARS